MNPSTTAPQAAGDGPRFRTLLYRYFFFAWLFRDASRGNLLERAAAWRHNRAQSRWLPTYLRRWLALGVLLYTLGAFVEVALAAPLWSALFYAGGSISLPVGAVIGVAWWTLQKLPGPMH